MSTSSQRAGAAQADDLFCPASAIPQAMANNTNTYFGPGGILSKMESVADIYPVGQSLLRRGDRLNYYIALACVLLVAYFFRSKREKHVEAPFFKAGKLKWIFDAENQIRASYNKFYNKVYQIKATEGLQVLIPPSLVGELKGLPEDVLSAQEAVREALMSNYTKFSPGENSELLSALVRTKLTHNLARLVPQLKDELEYITATELSECKDWTPVKLQPFALRTIARLSGRAFVGPSLNRNEEWMQTSIKYAIDVFLSVVELQFFPTWMRSVAQHIVPHIRKTRRNVARARALLQPILEERVRDMDAPGFEAPDDLLQWVLGSLPEERRTDYQAQTELQLILSAASIHTTNSLLVDCFFDLAAETDVQEELRQEVLEVVADDDEWSKKDCIPRLKKLDSFIKEVQRTSGNITSFIRKVIKPITLSDGTYLPAGTKLLAPQTGISHDARYFPEPERFDALRFYRLRQQSDDDANRHQLTSLSDVNLNFGAGKHACPGRFFAGNEIKLVLAYFLLHYDMKLRDGQDRPRPVMMMMTKTPNPNVEIEFRRRSSVE